MYGVKIKTVYLEDRPEYYLKVDSDGYVSASDALKTMTANTPVDLKIPSEINGRKVTDIGYRAFNDCKALRSVIIPGGVKAIGQEAFRGCTSITEINILFGVIMIKNSAFDNCTSLTIITIPNSVTDINNYAFNNCTSLTIITIPSGVTTMQNSVFTNCPSLTTINVSKPKDSLWAAPWGATNATVNWGW